MMNVMIVRMLLAAALVTGVGNSRSMDVEAKIVYVDARNGFIVIDQGKRAGLGPDLEYTIVREAGNRRTTVGSAGFAKFIGQDQLSKLWVDEQTAAQVKAEDIVVCRRKG